MLARTPEECLLPSLDKPSLEGLSYLLRHPEQWPDGFTWYYGDCSRCAMGLAHRLWGLRTRLSNPFEAVSDTAMALQMKRSDASIIFGLLHHGFDSVASVTPEAVADAIDAYLVRAE